MVSRRFKVITWTVLIMFVLTQAIGIKHPCACMSLYFLGNYLGVKIPENIDEQTLKNLELAANRRLAGKSLTTISGIAKNKCKDAWPAIEDAILYNPDGPTLHVDPLSTDPLVFICATSLHNIQNINIEQVDYSTLVFKEPVASNLVWEDQIVFTLELENKLIKHVSVAHSRKPFHMLTNLIGYTPINLTGEARKLDE